MRRFFVGGARSGEAEVLKVLPEAVEVRVGEKTFTIRVLRNAVGPLYQLSSGRVVRPSVIKNAKGEAFVSWPGRVVLVQPAFRSADATPMGVCPWAQKRMQAQMPGRVVKVLVKPGDEVGQGQGLVIIEAMKMENEVRAERPGKISKVFVCEGDKVETGMDLVEFE